MAQKNELRMWRKGKSEGWKKKGTDHKFDNSKAIASAVEKKVTERLKAIKEEETSGADAEAWVISIMHKHNDA